MDVSTLVKYKHIQLMQKLKDKGTSDTKIVKYFEGEGYSESDILREISSYEQNQFTAKALKEEPTLPKEEKDLSPVLEQ